MSEPTPIALETDPRFPSGPWTGFFVQKYPPLGRQKMDLRLTFRGGRLSGEGRDRVGKFVIVGRYDLTDGRCHWTKTYIGRHDVFYNGFNEGKGIWGVWEIPDSLFSAGTLRGGFHIWPEGMNSPSDDHLAVSLDLPRKVENEELVPAGAGAESRGRTGHDRIGGYDNA